MLLLLVVAAMGVSWWRVPEQCVGRLFEVAVGIACRGRGGVAGVGGCWQLSWGRFWGFHGASVSAASLLGHVCWSRYPTTGGDPDASYP